MPQDSGLDPKGSADMASAARRVLEDVAAEPIPERILELAEKLEETLGRRRLAAKQKTNPA
jgi:hypothetical protein